MFLCMLLANYRAVCAHPSGCNLIPTLAPYVVEPTCRLSQMYQGNLSWLSELPVLYTDNLSSLPGLYFWLPDLVSPGVVYYTAGYVLMKKRYQQGSGTQNCGSTINNGLARQRSQDTSSYLDYGPAPMLAACMYWYVCRCSYRCFLATEHP